MVIPKLTAVFLASYAMKEGTMKDTIFSRHSLTGIT